MKTLKIDKATLIRELSWINYVEKYERIAINKEIIARTREAQMLFAKADKCINNNKVVGRYSKRIRRFNRRKGK